MLLCACGEETPRAEIVVDIVTPAGEAPGGRSIRLEVAQGEGEPLTLEQDIDDGFDIAIPFADVAERVFANVRFEGDPVRHGAAAPFLPRQAEGYLRVLVGEPGTCEVVADLTLDDSRAAVAGTGTFALLAGDDGAEYVDLLRQEVGSFPETIAPFGAAQALPIDDRRALVVGARRSAIFDIAGSTRETEVALHDGAGDRSAVTALSATLVVAGGADTRAISFVRFDGSVSHEELLVERDGATAARLGSVAIVTGGADDPSAELVAPGEGSIAIPLDAPHAIAVSDGESRALLLGEGSVVLDDCPGECALSDGPSWDAREGVAVVAIGTTSAYLLGGTAPHAGIERVSLSPDATIEPAFALVHARARPSGLALPSGVLFVFGGEGEDGPRRDVEVCFPRELRLR